MSKKHNQKLINNEQGIVSIVLTVFVLIVLSLVVVAFSQNTRREQRQSLDRQLSAQAFYAAESGINQIVNLNNTNKLDKNEVTDCNDPLFSDKKILDSNTSSEGQGAFTLSCMLYDKHLPNVQWSSVGTRQGKVVSLHTVTNDLNKLTVRWTKAQNSSGEYGSCPSTAPVIENIEDSCGAGMLRIMLVPYSNGDNADALYNKSYTVFLKPSRPAGGGHGQAYFRQHGPGAAEANNQGNIVAAKCDDSDRCEATINDIPSGGNLFMHIRSIYAANAVDVAGYNIGGESIDFDQAQLKVDVTGKASDVVRRVQVRKPFYEGYSIPASVADAVNGVCKRLGVYPGTSGPGGAAPYANNDECGGIR